MDFLFWLDQLQNAHKGQVGDRLIQLSRILNNGYPVGEGFAIPDGVMRTVWSQLNSTDETLQDFPYLRFNFSLDQAVQVQFIAQTLQQNILNVTFDPTWSLPWTQAIHQLRVQSLMLTPYVWTPQILKDPLSMRLSLQPVVCDAQEDSFNLALKSLWASLWKAQNLYILQHLGLRPEQVHFSVLVQGYPLQPQSGYLKVTSTHLLIQLENSWEKGLTTTGDYVYDRCAKEVMKVPPLRNTQSLSEDVIQSLVDLGEKLEVKEPGLTVSWFSNVDDPSVQILGIVSDLPIPVKVLSHGRSQIQNAFTEASVQTALNARHPLGKGVSAVAGSIAAPVAVVHDFQTISPTALQGNILVTHHLEPIHLPWLTAAAGLICETGGVTSHGAILARELGRPAIMGASGILQVLQTGQWIFLDGHQGEVYPYEENRSLVEAPTLTHLSVSATPEHRSTQAQIFVQLSQPNLLNLAHSAGADGLGIIRGEWLLLNQLSYFNGTLRSPIESSAFRVQVQDALSGIAQAFEPQPVYYRFADLLSSDRELLLGNSADLSMGCHPALGLRGTLWHLHDARLFEMELSIMKAMLRKGSKNLRVILPFVRSPQEVQFCIEKMQAADIDPHHDVSLWMMVEVPSTMFALEVYKAIGIQGIAIGMNDLTQLLLGVDRDHSAHKPLLAQNQSVVMSVVSQLIQRATALNLSSIFCGSIVDYPARWLEQLLSDGLMGISVDIHNVASTRRAIAQAEYALSLQGSSVIVTNINSPQEQGFLSQVKPNKGHLL